MWYEPRILPRISFGVIVVPVSRGERRKWCFPVSIGKLCPHETGRGIEHVFIVLGGFHEIEVVILFIQGFGHLCHTPVIVGVFEGFGNRFFFEVTGNIVISSE